MNFEDTFEDFSSRTDIPSLFDTNSRDSGFEDSPAELLSDDAFLEEMAEFDVSTDFSGPVQRSIVTVTVEEKPSFRREKMISSLRKRICQGLGEDDGFFLKRRKISVEKPCRKIASSNTKHPSAFGSGEAIKSAIQRSHSEKDLIADFSKSYSLPLASSRHQDLKAISSNTLKQLLNGEFKDRVESFKIIDCRYPYEYNGGHIKNAINVYAREQCSAILEESSSRMSKKPEILIFHCEFSSKRGPDLYRYLRQEDRRRNVEMYPSLCFPEIYILEGGYEAFFKENSSMCSPSSYTRMLDPRHSRDLAYFRQFSDVKYTSKKQRIVRQFSL